MSDLKKRAAISGSPAKKTKRAGKEIEFSSSIQDSIQVKGNQSNKSPSTSPNRGRGKKGAVKTANVKTPSPSKKRETPSRINKSSDKKMVPEKKSSPSTERRMTRQHAVEVESVPNRLEKGSSAKKLQKSKSDVI